jgi:mRNA interferase MazF
LKQLGILQKMTRGEIWWVDFGIPFGSEVGYKRPALIVQDDNFNRSQIKTVIVIPFSTNLTLSEAPGNVFLEKEETALSKDSVLVSSLIASVDRTRLVEHISVIDRRVFGEVEEGIRILLGM